MKNNILSFFLTASIAFAANAQTTDTVSVGANYTNQVWYNLENGTKTTASGSSWDFGFEINGIAASILANTAYGAEMYPYPNGDTADWVSLDTAGMSNWTRWDNSPTNWDKGAFNMGVDTSNEEDLGWGKYNMMSHAITGDSLFVWKTANGKVYKIWIQELAGSTYRFLVADYSGNKVDTVALPKSNFSNKNFGYYSIANASIMDIEPVNTSWDLHFGKYIEDLGIPYGVTGVRTNKKVKAVKVYPIADPENYDSVKNHSYASAINTIGHDWKEFDLNNSTYAIEDSTVYFVKADSTTYWKLIMKGFGGSVDGNFIFEKTKILTTGLFEHKTQNQGTFMVYPNPAIERNISIIADLPSSVKEVQVDILSISGQQVQSEKLQIDNSFEAYTIQLADLSKGVYFIQLKHKGGSITKKLILK